jgi:phospholipase C
MPTLKDIEHIVVLMLENRSFDHMLGLLYAESHNVSPKTGQPFEGLSGKESNPDAKGKAIPIATIQPKDANAYFMPGVDPAEGYAATNQQLYGATAAPSPLPAKAPCNGFVQSFATVLAKPGDKPVGKVTEANIMHMFSPAALPVLSGLAKGFAVCDHWFASAPTETMPNRLFACAATSAGHVNDTAKTPYQMPSIFGLLSKNNVPWVIYGYSDANPYARTDFPDTRSASDDHFGSFTKDFKAAAANGTLPAFAFLEPLWKSTGNSQHPNYDVALGEQFIHDLYYALRNGPHWASTLLIITYDEHGGCYDHVSPPTNAVPPDATPGDYGFDFKRFGLRVPTVLVSPRIAQGTVFRAPGATPFDHTSILKTVEKRWGLPALTARDAAAPDLESVLTLAAARTDDPLKGVVVPTSGASPHSSQDPPTHLQQVHAASVAMLPVPGGPGGLNHTMPALKTGADADKYIHDRTEAWKASRKGRPSD